MLLVTAMSKMLFEVRQKNGSLVTARIGATNHSEEPHMGLAEIAIGGTIFIAAVGFVFFLLVI